MNSNQKTGRVAGALLLFVFISGIIIFQVLQGPVLFSDDYLKMASEQANQIISSIVLGILSGIASIVIAAILLPIFKKYSARLAYLYLALSILTLIAIMIDNVSIVSMLELSKEYLELGSSKSLEMLGTMFYEVHFWTHYFFMLISCFPVFVLYFILYRTKLVPRIIAVFGIIAVLLMFVEVVASIYGHSISMNMLLPMGLVQLVLPLWLIFKGLPAPTTQTDLNPPR